jgi:hypothetical protein
MFPGALRREILVLLAIKAVLLTVLYVLFFSPAHRIASAPGMAAHILGNK